MRSLEKSQKGSYRMVVVGTLVGSKPVFLRLSSSTGSFSLLSPNFSLNQSIIFYGIILE
jgi:hypothetical protein